MTARITKPGKRVLDSYGYEWEYVPVENFYYKIRVIGDDSEGGGYYANTFDQAVALLIHYGYIEKDELPEYWKPPPRVRVKFNDGRPDLTGYVYERKAHGMMEKPLWDVVFTESWPEMSGLYHVDQRYEHYHVESIEFWEE